MQTAATDAPAEIGHNMPEKSDEYLALEARLAQLIKTGNKWINGRPVFTDEEMAGKANDFITLLTAFRKAADALHKMEKAPSLAEGRRFDAQKNTLLDQVAPLAKVMNERKTAYLLEQKRIQDEAAEILRKAEELKHREAEEKRRLADEAIAAANAGENTDSDVDVVALQNSAAEATEAATEAAKETTAAENAKPKVHGSFSGSSGLRDHWIAEITDPALALKTLGDTPEVQAAVIKVANGLARSPASRGMTYPGIKFVNNPKA